MKLKSIIAAAIAAFLAVSAFAQDKAARSKSLVLYFSRADENYSVWKITEGNTAILAKICYTVRNKNNRSYTWNFMK